MEGGDDVSIAKSLFVTLPAIKRRWSTSSNASRQSDQISVLSIGLMLKRVEPSGWYCCIRATSGHSHLLLKITGGLLHHIWTGKNHNVPVDAFDMGASKKGWPLGLGYDRFYGSSAAKPTSGIRS